MAKEENLTPFTKDDNRAAEAGAKGGHAKKGKVHLSTLIQDLEDVDWELTALKNKDELKEKYGKNGWKALVHVAFSKAIAGDIKAMEWLSKNGYGEKLKIEVSKSPAQEVLEAMGLIENDGKTNTDS